MWWCEWSGWCGRAILSVAPDPLPRHACAPAPTKPSPKVPSGQYCHIRGSEPKSQKIRQLQRLAEVETPVGKLEATMAKTKKAADQVVVRLAAAGHYPGSIPGARHSMATG